MEPLRLARREAAHVKARESLKRRPQGWQGMWREDRPALSSSGEAEDDAAIARQSQRWFRRWGWDPPSPVVHGIVDFLVYDGEDMDDRYADWILAADALSREGGFRIRSTPGMSRSIATGVLYVREQRGKEVVQPPVPHRRPLGERDLVPPGGGAIAHASAGNNPDCRAPPSVRATA